MCQEEWYAFKGTFFFPLERTAAAQRYPHSFPFAAAAAVGVLLCADGRSGGIYRDCFCVCHTVGDDIPDGALVDSADTSRRRSADRLAVPHQSRPERQGYQYGAGFVAGRNGTAYANGTADFHFHRSDPLLRRQCRTGRCGVAAGRQRGQCAGTGVPSGGTG